jgi:selenocysteine lyase/cysteine desulfurase
MPSSLEISEERLRRWREDTPGCGAHARGRIHLNNAGAALMPRPVLDAIRGHLDLEAEIGGYEAEDAAAGAVREAYGHLARLLGARRPENIAIVENATVAVAQALSAFDFRPGDVLVTTHNDYTSNQIMYLSLAGRSGLQVLRADDLPEGGVDPGSVRKLAAHPRCRLVSLTWVPTNSGLVQAAEEVGEICEAAGVPYLLDACQAVGQLPVDVARLGCDFLAGTSRKFLRGPRGLGFLYVSDRALERGMAPLFVDMHGAGLLDEDRFELAPDARRFENWEFPYALVLGLGAAARYALEFGLENGSPRSIELGGYLRDRLRALPGVEVADRGARVCAIVTAEALGWDARKLVQGLQRAGVNTSASNRGGGPPWALGETKRPLLRISPHYYNTQEEIDRTLGALEELLRQGPAEGAHD